MSREVRRVPADWQHPRDENGCHIPLLDDYEKDLEDFRADIEKKGLADALDYWNGGPKRDDYIFPEGERTHYMMYETCSEGTPISPAFATIEELAHWLADTGASAFGVQTASYEAWLATCKRGHAISAYYSPETGIISGVEAELGFSKKWAT